MKISQLGWIISAALIGGALTTAFQEKPVKIGFVDFGSAFSQSNLKQQEEAQFQAKAQQLRDALNFANLNQVFTEQQLSDFQKYVLADPQTPADQDALKKLEADVTTASKLFDQLQQKSAPTPDDTAQLNDLANRRNFTYQSLNSLQSTFSQFMANFKQKQAQEASDKIQAAAEKVAKKQGFTLVFSDNSAVYGGEDLTDQVAKSL